MVVPLIMGLILAVLISRTAKKLNISKTAPMLAAFAVYFLIVVIIRELHVQLASDPKIAFVLSLLVHVSWVVILYGFAFTWMEKKCLPLKKSSVK